MLSTMLSTLRRTSHGSASVVIDDVLLMAARMIEVRAIAVVIPHGGFGEWF
jgi:hypothetical protein